nr:TnsA endonuclease N-terminal domain-containing protein [Deinococcus sp. 6YEL10]
MTTSGSGPVRRIGKSGRSITGTLPPCRGIPALAYESALERDFYRTLLFDLGVTHIQVQPVRLRYQHPNGRWLPYVPDALVIYGDGRPPGLFEVKYVKEVQEKRQLLRGKFRVARAHMRGQGGTFTLVTERSIRASTAMLKNMDMLFPFLTRTVAQQDCADLLSALERAGQCTPQRLLEGFAAGRKGILLPALWHLVATKVISVDLNLPLTMDSPVWLEGSA